MATVQFILTVELTDAGQRHSMDDLAGLLAAAALKRQGSNVYSAGIPWDLIHELRAAFEEVGIDALAVKAAGEYPAAVGPVPAGG